MKPKDTNLYKLVLEFVAKCGGLDKVIAVRKTMQKIPKEEIQDFINRISKSKAGSQQLIALAISGAVLSETVIRGGFAKGETDASRSGEAN